MTNMVSFNDSDSTIGNRIRSCRLNWRLTQDELAAAIDVTPNYIGEIERGRRPLTLPVAEQLCLYFGITYDYLYLGIERPPEALLRDATDSTAKENAKNSCKNLLLSFILASEEEDCQDYIALLAEVRKIVDRKTAE
jgi:transcriptional regulator with XRE-family HTH domain